jgi:cytochrome P450
MVRRIADCELEIGEQKVMPEQNVIVALGAANRDPSMFAEPDKLDIARANAGKHVAFGHGIHHCLGSSLAETEAQIAIGTMLKRMPNFKLKTEKLEYKEPFSLRGLKSLPLIYC